MKTFYLYDPKMGKLVADVGREESPHKYTDSTAHAEEQRSRNQESGWAAFRACYAASDLAGLVLVTRAEAGVMMRRRGI